MLFNNWHKSSTLRKLMLLIIVIFALLYYTHMQFDFGNFSMKTSNTSRAGNKHIISHNDHTIMEKVSKKTSPENKKTITYHNRANNDDNDEAIMEKASKKTSPENKKTITYYNRANNDEAIMEKASNTESAGPKDTKDGRTIMENPIYSKFNITPAIKRKNVTILIIVSSGPKRYDRRQAIRETYWIHCKRIKKVIPECIFMTDYQNPNDTFYNITTREAKLYGDMRFQRLTGGISFGIRFLYHMVWATLNNFDYFLRVDDDYFFCLDRFLYELPIPMVQNFHWGWVHCIDGITRPEESMILFSNDIIKKYLAQNPEKMQCHPWADQMIGLWSNDLNITELFRHDSRLHHTPIVSKEPELRSSLNICEKYIGIHGSYPADMKLFWKNRGNSTLNKTATNLIEQSTSCISKYKFDWRRFMHIWKYEPKLCISNPTWDTTKQTVLDGPYTGRQGHK